MRTTLLPLFACAAAIAGHAMAEPQAFPARPVRIIDGFVAGGNTDVLARTLAAKLSESWSQPVIVDNRPGASGNLGAEIVARAQPNGHTMLMGWTTTIAISRTLYPKMGYDPVRDLAPVAMTASSLLVLLVNPALPVQSVADLVKLAKAKPGHLNYASAGSGSGTHLAMELLKPRAGVDLVHVAYKGGAPAVAAITAGETQIGFASLAASLPLIKAGRLKGVAVTTPQRASALPEVPTIAESGFPGFDVTTRYGLFAPVGTPRAVVMQVNAEVERVLKITEVVERLRGLGLEAKTGTPEALGEAFRREIALYEKVIRDGNIKAD